MIEHQWNGHLCSVCGVDEDAPSAFDECKPKKGPFGRPLPAKADLREVLGALEELDRRKTFRRLDFFKPYPKQQEFMSLGATKRERLLMAGNQLGKSETGAAEVAYHLTGEYPKDWTGRRWGRPVKAWAAGETATVVRDVQQKKLCGEPGVVADFGKGMIPKERFVDKPSMSRSATDAYDTIQVKHKSGGVSVLRFKSFEQGRQRFQGETLDLVWCDEEPPADIYSECLTRVTATQGMVFVTFTPLKGRSEVVLRYLDEPSADRVVTTMTIDDVAAVDGGHITKEQVRVIVDGYRPHEREARAKGVPILGSGRVFITPEEFITEPSLEYIPPHWSKIFGIDFGIDHPYAAALGLWDRDNDVIHIHWTFRASDELPIQHAAAMKRVGAAVPVAWPHDGNNRDKGSGKALSALYREQGLKMLPEHAQFQGGGYSLEAVVAEADARFKSGRLKIAAHLSQLLEEYRFLHRKEGLIVSTKDDIMSAVFKILMMKRYAAVVALGPSGAKKRRNDNMAEGLDINPFTGE